MERTAEQVREEAKAAQASIEQRRRAEARADDREAAQRSFQPVTTGLKAIVTDAAERSGFEIDWVKREVKERKSASDK
ncbi:MAG: hypothetical protein M3P27_03025 [Acidobacteriota bacterium]|nr:hypothetical protein [Acidobacteriota bacterium]